MPNHNKERKTSTGRVGQQGQRDECKSGRDWEERCYVVNSKQAAQREPGGPQVRFNKPTTDIYQHEDREEGEGGGEKEETEGREQVVKEEERN
ncbi:hypothetical protein E2C01_084774 [Portunus trituberculatus]|uniref:Uncharacterized protein n=1 Tax=Portunus trituberculatus TaxID=210409 RepID=A0A5B7JBT5_PORTR|nr:hypothetical protein [Portunus trituberculatus]